jgi:hypothetical protein
MDVLDIYESEYRDYTLYVNHSGTKYEWAANYIFDLCTYDGELDELFVKKIIEICKAIFDKTTYEYMKDKSKYITYILVCQLLDKFNWIDWGTSIRGAWFDDYSSNSRAIIDPDFSAYGDKKVPFCKTNFKILLDFLEKED